jgi:hypothetical protein
MFHPSFWVSSVSELIEACRALLGIILASFVTPALAANVEFYVVQNVASHRCSIKEQRLSQYPSEFLPANATMKLVGTTSYKTWAAAKAAMKADTICT